VTKSHDRQLVILAGGLGSRLKKHSGGLPKAMVPVGGKPILEHQVVLARDHGFTDIRLLTFHGESVIRDHFGDGGRWGVSIDYHTEKAAMGTAGAVLEALDELGPRFMVLYGDTVLDVDLEAMWQRHEALSADATLFVHPNDHPHDSDLIETDAEGWIVAFHTTPHPKERNYQNLVNAALYVVERSALEPWAPPQSKLDFARDLFPAWLAGGRRLYGYRSREYIKDVGTPERLAQAESDLASGRVRRLSLRATCPAVFLDRDGTLNREVDRVKSVDELMMIDGVGSAVRRINRHGLLAVVVTNQPVVARGECSEEELRRIHDKLETELGREGAYLDGLHYCPHHPDRGFPGERPELKIPCDCRKPRIGLIEKATEELRIEMAGSWMVGDSTVDLQTAHNAGIRAVLVRTGYAGNDHRFPAHADYEFHDLDEASEFITVRHAHLLERARALVPSVAPGSILAIGGLSRSGKSVWASVIREVLAERDQKAHVLSLDAWLRSEPERPGGDVRTRFDVDAIAMIAERLSRRTATVELSLGAYDRARRRHVDSGREVTIGPSDIVIFEGVLALDIERLRRVSSVTFFVECSEGARRRRFEKEYGLRGYSEAGIRELYESREADEHPIVRASKEFATVTIGERER
jgi:histidinol-phosphate phosphatase family protein